MFGTAPYTIKEATQLSEIEFAGTVSTVCVFIDVLLYKPVFKAQELPESYLTCVVLSLSHSIWDEENFIRTSLRHMPYF